MEASDLIDVLKQAIRECGLSLAEIARRSGVDHPRLSRFMRDERTLTLPAAARVCAVVGVRVVKEPMPDEAETVPREDEEAEAAKTDDRKPKKTRKSGRR
jgi:transcriptional regulator with XRE-family HTH domain